MSTARVVYSSPAPEAQKCVEAKLSLLETKIASLEIEESELVAAAQLQKEQDAATIAALKAENQRLEQSWQASHEIKCSIADRSAALEAERHRRMSSTEAHKNDILVRASCVEAEVLRLKRQLGMSDATSEGADTGHLSSAVIIQSAWRRTQASKKKRGEEEEVKKRLNYSRCIAGICRIQQLWRIHQEYLRHRRQELEALRKTGRCPSTKYDLILLFESLSEAITAGRIELLKSAESNFGIVKEGRYRIVAVVGLFDKGKTFLINRLFGVHLPAGKLFTTKGMSFLWIKERRLLVLDSAGVQATVSYRAQAVQPILDAQTTESLIFEMVSRIAHHMIFVVNDLTWFEQKYIAMLHQKYVRSRQAKELIVVHNLRTTSSVDEARQLFKKQITQCYEGEASHLGDLIFTADHGLNVPQVHHVGICDECTPAGKMFNDRNCNIVLQMLEIREMLGSTFVLSDFLRSQFEQLLPKFVNVEPLEQKARPQQTMARDLTGFPSHESSLVVNYVASSATVDRNDDGYVTAGILGMQTSQPGYRMAMKTRGVISSLGEIIAHDVSFEPTVNVYDRRGEKSIKRIIEVECPKVAEDDVDWEELANGVKITIRKHKAIDEMSVHPVHPIRQHHGVWEREFRFDPSEGRYEICPEQFALEHGVLTITLSRPMQARKGKLGRGIGATAIRMTSC